jgi:hypothetical protein
MSARWVSSAPETPDELPLAVSRERALLMVMLIDDRDHAIEHDMEVVIGIACLKQDVPLAHRSQPAERPQQVNLATAQRR